MKSTLTLGPFVGGLNNAANTPDTIADNELFVCQDFDYNIDQTLVTRPPVAVEALTGNGTIDHQYFNILGFFVDPSTGNAYCLACINGNLYYRANSTSYKDAGSWTLITSGFTATAGVQYVDSFYFCKASAGGGKWSIASGYSAIASMPALNSLTVFKERLWGSSAVSTTSARLLFSNIGTGDTWTVSDFIDIGAGDGQKLICAYAGPSAIYLFKTNSTYVLTYDSKPSFGYVQNISRSIGLFDPNCVTSYEGTIFLMYGNVVYRLQGYLFNRINLKVVIDRNTTAGTYPQAYALSTVGDRIIATYADNTYIYYPLTNTWSQWKLPATGRWFNVPNSLAKYGYKIFLAPINSTAPSGGSVLSLQDKVWDNTLPADVVVADPIIITKMYSFDSPETFKRLHWWGADAIVYQSSQQAYIRLTAIPYMFSSYETWDLLKGTLTWNDLKQMSWDDMKQYVGGVPTYLLITSKDRKYLKANKSIRFTRIQFKAQLYNYDHTATSSINHLILCMSSKESPVSKSEGTNA